MHMSVVYMFLIFLASLIAGAMNSVAGGGTLVTFPTLLFVGVQPIVANASNTMGLWPATLFTGWLYREHIETSRRMFALLMVVSIAGGFLGAWLLLHTPERIFNRLIPLLLCFAAIVFTFSRHIRAVAERMSIPSHWLAAAAAAGQFGIAVYGGYFGAGMGVLMLSLYSLTLSGSIHSMMGVRSICGTAINAMAVIVFIAGHRIDWLIAALVAAGSIVGAGAGTLSVRRLQPALARRVVLVVAWGMTLAYIAKMGF
jgi:uncharacterized membrane protein YfcA